MYVRGSTLTTVLSVSLCPNPTPLAAIQRRENKGTSHWLIYLYPPVLPITTGAFISLRPTLKPIISQGSKVKRPLFLSFCLSWTHWGLLLPFRILLVFPDGNTGKRGDWVCQHMVKMDEELKQTDKQYKWCCPYILFFIIIKKNWIWSYICLCFSAQHLPLMLHFISDYLVGFFLYCTLHGR